jgi:hypothetical protein
VVLDWTDSPGATFYKVQVRLMSPSGPLLVNTRTTLSKYQTPRLNSRIRYYWRVCACNAAGCSAWTDYWSFTLAVVASVNGWTRDDWMKPPIVIARHEASGQNH